jgi:phage shock protein C
VNDRLYRSRDDRIVGGVCAGLAERFDLDPSLVRILWAVLSLLSGLLPGAVLYVVMLIVVPEEPEGAAVPGAAPPPWPTEPPSQDPATGQAPAVPPAAEAASATAGAGAAWTAPAPSTSSERPGTGTGTTAWVPPAQAYADRRARRAARRHRNDGAVALVFGVLLILVGAWFLLRPYLPSFDWGVLWPIIIIGLGVVLLVGALARRTPTDGGDPPTA